ncbi:sensor histidine kinase [Nesterenkonia ebinurensis]|uniref:sensor histidine kinase n=1 Tax=Nesterenkonia ebinurensis TaxID=2608252 RepID=UPI00168B3396|nr:histidine kinase [Nesterenkonia ebinurensis]
MTFGTPGGPRESVGLVTMEDQWAPAQVLSEMSGRSRRRRWEEFSGIAILGLCFGVGVLMLAVGGDPYIPSWLWAGLLIGCLSAVVLAASGRLSTSWQNAAYAAAVLSSWALLLTMPDQGMLVVILVVVAAVGSYLIPIPMVLGVIGLNCAVVLGHMVAHGAAPVEYLATTVFYMIIHLASMFSTYALYREIVFRSELEQKNLELEAAGVLLEDSAATAERLRISRELHDAMGHQLTVLNLELEAAKHRSAGSRSAQDASAHIDRAAGVAKQLLADVRATVGELRETGPGDLQTHLERLAAAVPSLEIQVDVAPVVAVDDQQTAALVRAAQEIITNAVKHSQAQQLSLTLGQAGPEVVLTGSNDGLAPKTITLGHGLTGLRERVELLGGQLRVSSSPQFTIQVRLPAAGQSAAPGLRDEPAGAQ